MLHELGPVRPPVDTGTVHRALCGDLARVRQGLYVFVFSNDSEFDVFDNPKSKKRRKVVVQGRGASIKPGKFEKGFADRVQNYSEHLHRLREGQDPEFVLGECFAVGYLFDLSDAIYAVQTPARIFEQYWIEAVGRYLVTNELLAGSQKARAEWRHMGANRWSASIQADFRQYLDGVVERIFDMARVGAYPVRPPVPTP